MRKPSRRIALVSLLAALVATAAVAHDMYLKPTRYFAPENSEVRIRVLNGTFTKSENSIARNRVADVSMVTPVRRVALDITEWTATGDTSTFHIHTRGAGTYVVGASTRPSVIELTGEEFNLYLREDGIPDMLEARRVAGELDRPARERYSKHVKALVQVGTARSSHFGTALGYPAELIPLDNPYGLAAGASLRVRTLVDGRPVANQLVVYGGTGANDAAFEPGTVRSSPEGVATIPIASPGIWYVKFIHMAKVTGDSVTHESKWASLTFQIR